MWHEPSPGAVRQGWHVINKQFAPPQKNHEMFCRFFPYTNEPQNNGKIDGCFKYVQDANLAWLESPPSLW